ncbi:uncharacterized protein LOC124365145 [Homalodisca vitripennis]|uniref:Uncharacterized protein n=1 Tax=Homalodisca liturata TaxID=320908 RepID=A0A1B6IEH1_9HEMI|nr:uncharacterized protein LOC124365145 [Homalodisca vitripennis]KAG8307090.1 hypothetical protein J6590_031490 [Homalodisca vitripennis]
MRLTCFLNKRGWLPENKVEFQELLPLKLKNSVSGKGERSAENPCVQEMMVLFACLKKSEFHQSPCSKEIDTLNKCYKTHQVTVQKEKELMKMGILTPGAKDLNHRQIGMLLKRFPTK